MTLFLHRFVLIFLLALTLSGCGRGLRDSLLLTGLRDKPDESKIQVNDVLVLPSDDQVVAPNTTTNTSFKRTDAYKVNSILFGEEVAEAEADRQIAMAQQNAYSPTEAQLLKHAYSISTNTSSQLREETRPWWKISIPKLLNRN